MCRLWRNFRFRKETLVSRTDLHAGRHAAQVSPSAAVNKISQAAFRTLPVRGSSNAGTPSADPGKVLSPDLQLPRQITMSS